MQTYKVDVTHIKPTKDVTEAVHVTATNREQALYKACDEMADRGYKIKTLGEVSMFDEKTDTWHVIPDHRELSKAVA